jgi:hypothetical protein
MSVSTALLAVRSLQYGVLRRLLHVYEDDADGIYPIDTYDMRVLNGLLRTRHKDEKVTAEEVNSPCEVTDTYFGGSGHSAHTAVGLHITLNNALSALSGLQQGGGTAEEQATANEVVRDAVKTIAVALGFDVDFKE